MCVHGINNNGFPIISNTMDWLHYRRYQPKCGSMNGKKNTQSEFNQKLDNHMHIYNDPRINLLAIL